MYSRVRSEMIACIFFSTRRVAIICLYHFIDTHPPRLSGGVRDAYNPDPGLKLKLSEFRLYSIEKMESCVTLSNAADIILTPRNFAYIDLGGFL